MLKNTIILCVFALLIVIGFANHSVLSDFDWNSINAWIGFVAAIVSVLGIFLQYRLSRQEQASFRQQLVAVMHHASGIVEGLSSIENGSKTLNNPLLTFALEALRKNASDLQMGLIETKVGGKQLSDDLDDSYKEWAKLNLDLRKLPLKHFLEDKENERKPINSSST